MVRLLNFKDDTPTQIYTENMVKLIEDYDPTIPPLSKEEFLVLLKTDNMDAIEKGLRTTINVNAEPGDELWAYDNMGILCGWRGYVLLRQGKVVSTHVTWRS